MERLIRPINDILDDANTSTKWCDGLDAPQRDYIRAVHNRIATAIADGQPIDEQTYGAMMAIVALTRTTFFHHT